MVGANQVLAGANQAEVRALALTGLRRALPGDLSLHTAIRTCIVSNMSAYTAGKQTPQKNSKGSEQEAWSRVETFAE